ncbi:hypothetical protein ACJ41O_013330 [Fusarium nematophilum]
MGRSKRNRFDQPRIHYTPVRTDRRLRTKSNVSIRVRKGERRSIEVRVDSERMAAVCPNWDRIRHQSKKGPVDVPNVNFKQPDAEMALGIVVDLAHGNRFLRAENTNPRSLYYMTELHDWLGKPAVVYAHDEQPSLVANRTAHGYPFFPLQTIENQADYLVEDAEYMHLVEDWVLLGVVAKRLDLGRLWGRVCEELSLFCWADQTSLPKEVRDSLTKEQWSAAQLSGLINVSVLERRKAHVEHIFESIRLLSDQLIYHESGVLPNEELVDLYEKHHVAPCSWCKVLPSEELIQELLREKLWPLSPGSYPDRPIDLIQSLKEMDIRIRNGLYCNQLSHLCDHLFKVWIPCADWGDEREQGMRYNKREYEMRYDEREREMNFRTEGGSEDGEC